MIQLLTKTNKKWGAACSPFSSLLETIEKELDLEYNSYNIYPLKEDIFNAFKIDPEEVKVLILGQDPFSKHNQAHGLAFSCIGETPPSLQVIFYELERVYRRMRFDSILEDWRDQGVLLLNSILTVRRGAPMSHSHIPWSIFTSKIIKGMALKGVVILSFGTEAKNVIHESIKKCTEEEKSKMNILEVGHPAADARGNGKMRFYGSSVFKNCNDILISKNLKPINWINENSTISTDKCILEGIITK